MKTDVEALRDVAPTNRMQKFVGAMGPAIDRFAKGLIAATNGNTALMKAQSQTVEVVDRLTAVVHAFRDGFIETQKTAQQGMLYSMGTSQNQAMVTPVVAILLGLTFA